MKNNGLTDSELQTYHHSLEYTGNFFLSDILDSDFFLTEEESNHTKIYPLFYCSEISTDHDDVMINSPYLIIVANDFKGLISFHGNDGQTITNKNYDLSDNDTYYTIVIYDDKTKEILPNQTFTIHYTSDEYADETYTTTKVGYYSFTVKSDSFEVII